MTTSPVRAPVAMAPRVTVPVVLRSRSGSKSPPIPAEVMLPLAINCTSLATKSAAAPVSALTARPTMRPAWVSSRVLALALSAPTCRRFRPRSPSTALRFMLPETRPRISPSLPCKATFKGTLEVPTPPPSQVLNSKAWAINLPVPTLSMDSWASRITVLACKVTPSPRVRLPPVPAASMVRRPNTPAARTSPRRMMDEARLRRTTSPASPLSEPAVTLCRVRAEADRLSSQTLPDPVTDKFSLAIDRPDDA